MDEKRRSESLDGNISVGAMDGKRSGGAMDEKRSCGAMRREVVGP